MGWWSEDLIRGGDSALDALGELEKKIGWNYGKSGFIYEEENAEEAHRRLTTKTGSAKVMTLLRSMAKDDYEMDHGAALAVVSFLVKVGVKFTTEMERIARDAAERDEWAKEDGPDSIRAENVRRFLQRLDKNVGKLPAGKKLWRVGVCKTSHMDRDFEVEAWTADEAQAIALEEAERTHYGQIDEVDHDYEVNEVSEL